MGGVTHYVDGLADAAVWVYIRYGSERVTCVLCKMCTFFPSGVSSFKKGGDNAVKSTSFILFIIIKCCFFDVTS